MNRKIFFRKNTAIYFHERKEITVYFLTDEDTYYSQLSDKSAKISQNFKFNFHVEITKENGDQRVLMLEDVLITKMINMGVKLSSFLDLNDILSVNNLKLKIAFTKIDNVSNQIKTNEAIQVKLVKKDESPLTKDIRICLEPSFMEPKDYADLKWFVELNEMIGFEKIIFLNNSIPNTAEFRSLFESKQQLIEVYPFNYLPNLRNPALNKVYATHMEEMTIPGKEYGAGLLYHYLNDFGINECLLNNRDKASLIFFPDTDETFLPNRLKNFDYPDQTFKLLSSAETKLDTVETVLKFKDEYLSESNCLSSDNQKSNVIKGGSNNVTI